MTNFLDYSKKDFFGSDRSFGNWKPFPPNSPETENHFRRSRPTSQETENRFRLYKDGNWKPFPQATIGSPTTRDSAIGSPTTRDLATGLFEKWRSRQKLLRPEAENRKFRQDWLGEYVMFAGGDGSSTTNHPHNHTTTL